MWERFFNFKAILEVKAFQGKNLLRKFFSTENNNLLNNEMSKSLNLRFQS